MTTTKTPSPPITTIIITKLEKVGDDKEGEETIYHGSRNQ